MSFSFFKQRDWRLSKRTVKAVMLFDPAARHSSSHHLSTTCPLSRPSPLASLMHPLILILLEDIVCSAALPGRAALTDRDYTGLLSKGKRKAPDCINLSTAPEAGRQREAGMEEAQRGERRE